MSSGYSKTTCLNAEDHGYAIKNPLLHYLGCIEIREREDFFKESNPLWGEEIKHQQSLRVNPEVPLESITKEASDFVRKLRDSWQKDCESELRRIAFLRKTLSEDEHDRHLVWKVENSGKEWQKCKEYRDNIDKVRKWRKDCGKPSILPAPVENMITESYIPEKDVSVPIIQFERDEGVCKGVNEADQRVWGKFPNQKTTVHNLLRRDGNKPTEKSLLHKDLHPDRIKYYHLPSNNMMWAEEAISKYFSEDRPDYNSMHRHLKRENKTRTYMILQERYWGAPKTDELEPNNMVLFMPYLHWETSRRREQFATETERIVRAAAQERVDSEAKEKERRQKERQAIYTADIEPEPTVEPNNFLQDCLAKMSSWWQEKNNAKHQFGLNRSFSLGRIVAAKSPNMALKVTNMLGKYLLAAAKLYEGMANYRDKKLLRKYLPANTPIHPRRTLDQAFYWTLDSTKIRDRDQVVYRGTTVKAADFHSYDHKKKLWPDHKMLPKSKGCDNCKANIQKVSRVIMVDQLWMWILDAKTIITCFPKRYGANKRDTSGVHKSIRDSLQNLDPHQIRTVFDLGLIIIDQCSKTFFDRTKTIDRQPQVIDEFSKAIGNIMDRKTEAFAKLRKWTDEARVIYRSRGYIDTSKLHVPLLDIYPEGQLEREIEDIIEELDIMLHISTTHCDILRNFVSEAENILDPEGQFRNRDSNKQQWMFTVQLLREVGHDQMSLVEDSLQVENKTSAIPSDKKKLSSDERDYQCFKRRANDLQDKFSEHIKELGKLRKTAKDTADDVLHLLGMKQQQAGVVQAWQAVKQSQESIKQGRSIMTFTLVTIIFLPLSFLSSVFGMNNKEFGGSDNPWSISDQFIYIFSISAGVVSLSLFLAFSSWIRAWIWSLSAKSTTKLLIWTGLYDIWKGYGKPTEDIYEEAAANIDRQMNDRDKLLRERELERRELELRLKQMFPSVEPRVPATATDSMATGSRYSLLNQVGRPFFTHRKTHKNEDGVPLRDVEKGDRIGNGTSH
ncbi:hypothetical protein F5Y19DRAFT_473222 [Xylariaceae sp. FL1651]|nr:hypothetical protein F5Y19DRAFT_473222 [Xylariaceae sp. FL1651]